MQIRLTITIDNFKVPQQRLPILNIITLAMFKEKKKKDTTHTLIEFLKVSLQVFPVGKRSRKCPSYIYPVKITGISLRLCHLHYLLDTFHLYTTLFKFL